MSDPTAEDMIRALDLQPHPEGGWYRETWRTTISDGNRASATAIIFLLAQGERSHWHRVDADELWIWQGGAALTLFTALGDDGPINHSILGPDLLAGQVPQGLVSAGQWQAAEPDDGWVLVSCVVSPGFDFSGFELAPSGWEPGPN